MSLNNPTVAGPVTHAVIATQRHIDYETFAAASTPIPQVGKNGFSDKPCDNVVCGRVPLRRACAQVASTK